MEFLLASRELSLGFGCAVRSRSVLFVVGGPCWLRLVFAWWTSRSFSTLHPRLYLASPGPLLSLRGRQQRRPLLSREVCLHGCFQILPDRSPLLNARRYRGPNPLTPALSFLPACPLGYVSVDHHETDRLFCRVVRRRHSRRRDEPEIPFPEFLHPCCQV